MLEPAAAAEALAGAGEPGPDGMIPVRFRVEHIDYTHDMLLPLGAGIVVLSPPELRARLAATAHALAERYS